MNSQKIRFEIWVLEIRIRGVKSFCDWLSTPTFFRTGNCGIRKHIWLWNKELHLFFFGFWGGGVVVRALRSVVKEHARWEGKGSGSRGGKLNTRARTCLCPSECWIGEFFCFKKGDELINLSLWRHPRVNAQGYATCGHEFNGSVRQVYDVWEKWKMGFEIPKVWTPVVG